MVDIVTIGFKAEYGDLKEVQRALQRIVNEGKRLDKSNKNLQKSFISLKSAIGFASAAIAAIGTSKLASNIISTTAEFQKLEASLITVTGSADAAGEAFENISNFASETPFALTEVTDAFIKMSALGLNPSERALRSYGDTASSMGKSLNQMVEAVADAATGEFERLKEFGIRASQQGDEVALTFAGVTTTVSKNADEIQNYLLELGEQNFAGGMARQMETIGGKLSNMGDQWDKTFAVIGDSSSGLIGGAIAGITGLGSAIEDLFLTTEEWAKKHGHIASETEKLTGAQRVLELQISDARNELELANMALGNAVQYLNEDQLALFKTSEYYKQLTSDVDIAKQALNELNGSLKTVTESNERLSLLPSMDAELDNIDKQFTQVGAINATFQEDQAILKQQYRENSLEADYNQMARELDIWEQQNEELATLEEQKDLMRRKWRQKDLDDEKAAAQQKMQIAMTVGDYTANALGQLASMQNRESKEGFENYKKYASAQIAVSTAMAAIKAYSEPALPFPANVAFSGVIAGLGAAQIAQVNAQQFQPSQTTAYAKGGVVDSPTFFSTPSSSSNVMGEAGAEAIMPLKRNSRGELGVDANGGMGKSAQINFSIQAVDAAGIQQLLMSNKNLITNIVRRGM